MTASDQTPPMAQRRHVPNFAKIRDALGPHRERWDVATVMERLVAAVGRWLVGRPGRSGDRDERHAGGPPHGVKRRPTPAT
jgi:hypothetical protein